MPCKLLGIIAVSAAAAGTPLASALAANSKGAKGLPKGDLVVTFRGSGGGTYRFHQPAVGGSGASACRVADTTYTEIDSYRWSYRFVLPPAGGSSAVPSALAASGQLSGTEQLLQCADAAVVTSNCTQALRAPPLSNSSDLAYPGITVGASGRLVTVGAVGELIPSTPAPICSGVGVFMPNLVQGFAQLQASVRFSRARLAGAGDVVRRFTMAGSGLYKGVALSGGCNSASCAVATCANGAGGAGEPSACSFSENYVGTIEVRVVR
jgi:hypothetical protein